MLQEVSQREAARMASESLPQFFQDRSPRSRHIFETLIDIANRELMVDRTSEEGDILRRIATGLNGAAESLSPQVRAGQPSQAAGQMARRPTAALAVQGLGATPFVSPSEARLSGPPLQRVPNYGAGQFQQSGHNVPFPGTETAWSLPLQPPPSQTLPPGISVLQQGHPQNPQQHWPEWSWSQFQGMVLSPTST